MGIMRRIAGKIKRTIFPSPEVQVRIQPGLPSCEDRLKHAASLGYSPGVVFDCGAFIGRWAREVHQIFPGANLVLIEPNSELYARIAENTQPFSSQVQLIEAAVGEQDGRMQLNIWENPKHGNETTALAASSLLDHVQGQATRSLDVAVKRIDDIAQQAGCWPDLLKLDLQGAELPALKGAVKALENCELCIIEFGCLEAYKERTTPAELMSFMDEMGFALYDIVDVRYRPYDKALVGGDFFFVKRNSALKSHKDYF
ncbi:FkbM family methyltransferase [Haliea sp. E17]|uniref:FkbM family methyltransferase n=1 Tax=Haliea sp. E17 TaxID=3401576 RepID=UPI003AB069A5